MLSALFRVTERLFPFGRFDSHAFTLGFRERMVLDAGQREGNADGGRHVREVVQLAEVDPDRERHQRAAVEHDR